MLLTPSLLQRVHSGYYLNDNLDGTFTVIESRKAKQYKPSVVISKTLNDSDPVVRPKYPRHTTGKNPVWVDLFDEDTVIDHNTAISNDTSGSRIAGQGPRQSASAQKRFQGKGPPSPEIIEDSSQEADEHAESPLRINSPQTANEAAQGRTKKMVHMSEPTNPASKTIHSDVGIRNTKTGRPYASFIGTSERPGPLWITIKPTYLIMSPPPRPRNWTSEALQHGPCCNTRRVQASDGRVPCSPFCLSDQNMSKASQRSPCNGVPLLCT